MEAGVHHLDALVRGSEFEIAELGRTLDALSPAARLSAVRSLSGPAQARLYEAARDARRMTLEDLVPAELAPLTEVVHDGKNSLPLFRHFAKVFCRPAGEARELCGYNRTGGLVRRAAGPGYFTAYEGPGDALLIDYGRLPSSKPKGWPDIVPNEERLGRFVYAGMIDALRRVSAHVSVGRAIRHGKVQDNWFVLCRVASSRS